MTAVLGAVSDEGATYMGRNEEPGGLGINGIIPGDGRCVIDGCGPCPDGALMCRPHWRSVPTGLKDNLRYVMSRWWSNDATLADVRTAQWACVEAAQ